MSGPERPCSIAIEDSFGAIVSGSCKGGFDFTLLFEEAILTIVPLGIACAFSRSLLQIFLFANTVSVVWALLRIWALRGETAKVRSSWLLPLKMVRIEFKF